MRSHMDRVRATVPDSQTGGAQDEEAAIFEAFKPFFEDPSIMKVWHNYSFDRHVMKRMVRLPQPGD